MKWSLFLLVLGGLSLGIVLSAGSHRGLGIKRSLAPKQAQSAAPERRFPGIEEQAHKTGAQVQQGSAQAPAINEERRAKGEPPGFVPPVEPEAGAPTTGEGSSEFTPPVSPESPSAPR